MTRRSSQVGLSLNAESPRLFVTFRPCAVPVDQAYRARVPFIFRGLGQRVRNTSTAPPRAAAVAGISEFTPEGSGDPRLQIALARIADIPASSQSRYTLACFATPSLPPPS